MVIDEIKVFDIKRGQFLAVQNLIKISNQTLLTITQPFKLIIFIKLKKLQLT